ncbi:DUF6069 family protein [Nocardioides sp. T2.26MG-1]|uniref:DUF6069 family protein n=1 Tax=Nocardioides sp. T2.26MG-1 TaxID=3041166 RepID=UPI0024779B18|nr:DUF6069 family protein [Nocardioides sp. T2.26MG-1]CAI9412519.1 hypothetical protein HIDPHFAB_01792 [Nocardioides sp. T2.26MG-1]
MTTITTTAPRTTRSTRSARPAGSRVTWRAGVATTVAAALVVAMLAVAFDVAGAPLGVEGEPIPPLGFAQLVVISGVIGIVVARHVGRTAFLRTTVTLTALSCVPSIALGTTAGDKAGLVLTHLVAAAIIVPRLAPRR